MQNMPEPSNGLSAQLTQLAPLVKSVIDRLKPVIDQPIIRFPYNLPSAATFTVAAATSGQRMPDSWFIHALEWPFEVHSVKFSQDPQHSFRDWRVLIKDQTFNQDMTKSEALVATMVADNTGMWELDFPWIVRPKGGGLSVNVTNLDAANSIGVDINFQGYLLIPRV